MCDFLVHRCFCACGEVLSILSVVTSDSAYWLRKREGYVNALIYKKMPDSVGIFVDGVTLLSGCGSTPVPDFHTLSVIYVVRENDSLQAALGIEFGARYDIGSDSMVCNHTMMQHTLVPRGLGPFSGSVVFWSGTVSTPSATESYLCTYHHGNWDTAFSIPSYPLPTIIFPHAGQTVNRITFDIQYQPIADVMQIQLKDDQDNPLPFYEFDT
jgi:hypothetical protein